MSTKYGLIHGSYCHLQTQSAGLLIQSVYAVGMLIFPTSVILIAGLSFFDVSYKQWFKYIWKVLLSLFVLTIIAIVIVFVLV